MLKYCSNTRNYRQYKPLITFIIAGLMGLGLSLGGYFLPSPSFLSWEMQPVVAQSLRPDEAANKVYQLVPDLPQENQYLSQKTGEIDTKHTLVGRIVAYHIYIKGRPVSYRIDWKLTLADYLGMNEKIKPDNYPGYQALTQNPYENDLIAVQKLTRQQRNALVTALVQIYSPQNQNNPQSNPNSSQKPNPNTPPPLPQPGAADLLKF